MKKNKLAKYITPKNAGINLVNELKTMSNVEDLGSSIYKTSQQFYLLIQSILKAKYDFSEKQLSDLNKEVTKAVEALAWFEEKGLNPISARSVAQLVDVTLNHYNQFKAAKSGIVLPTSSIAKKLLGK